MERIWRPSEKKRIPQGSEFDRLCTYPVPRDLPGDLPCERGAAVLRRGTATHPLPLTPYPSPLTLTISTFTDANNCYYKQK